MANDDFTSVTSTVSAPTAGSLLPDGGSADEAEDLVQETYLRAWRAYHGFQGRSSVRTWLYRIATNTCLTAIERRGQRCAFPRVACAPCARAVPAGGHGRQWAAGVATYERGRDGVCRAHALEVLTVTPGGVARIVIFLDAGLFGSFRLPDVYGAAAAGAVLTGADRAGHGGSDG